MASYEDEAGLAQDVLDALAAAGARHIPGLRLRPGAKTAGVTIDGQRFTVNRFGNELRFHEQATRHGGAGRYLIVQVGRHVGGWLVARAVRPPGEYHDDRAAEDARYIVERQLVSLGHTVGTPGLGGEKKSAAVLDREIAEAMRRRASSEIAVVPKAKRRSRARR